MPHDWMKMAAGVAERSRDLSRRTGAVLVRGGGVAFTTGCNDLPHGVLDLPERRARPAKYKWTEHAERNAIYRAAREGIPTNGAEMFLTWYPCADCARAIIQAGIVRLTCIRPDWEDPTWREDFIVVREMLLEAGVAVLFADGSAPVAR